MNDMLRVIILSCTDFDRTEIQNKVNCNSRNILEIHNNYTCMFLVH